MNPKVFNGVLALVPVLPTQTRAGLVLHSLYWGQPFVWGGGRVLCMVMEPRALGPILLVV